jgi:hypothetical protein
MVGIISGWSILIRLINLVTFELKRSDNVRYHPASEYVPIPLPIPLHLILQEQPARARTLNYKHVSFLHLPIDLVCHDDHK